MTSNLRVGQGYDVHQTVKGQPLMIGGVKIPSEFGLLGHSDADVLLHAITDALLGAAGMGDIGTHFPDTDERWKDADSKVILKETLELVKRNGYYPINVDSTVIAQKPKLAPHMPSITKSLSKLLRLPLDCVNVKAKTNEKLGYLGRAEAIEAQAIVLMEKISSPDDQPGDRPNEDASLPPFLLGDLPVQEALGDGWNNDVNR